VVLVADLVVLEVVVATMAVMAVMAVHLARALAGAAAAEVAIRIQHFVALLFILKELKRLVLVLLYMEV